MFEDSTFETMGTIHTRSRGWMMATFAFNSSILVALILIPLMYPSVLPQIANVIQLLAPPTPVEEPKPVARAEHATATQTEMPGGVTQAPRQIPDRIWIPDTREEPRFIKPGDLGNSGPGPGGPLSGQGAHPDVRQAVLPAQHVSSGVMQGMLIYKVVPKYPPVAIAVRASGTVMLQATISRGGTIENLRVLGGPALLQQAALDAVKQWRYRPYVLDGQPVEVETTINVQFTLE